MYFEKLTWLTAWGFFAKEYTMWPSFHTPSDNLNSWNLYAMIVNFSHLFVIMNNYSWRVIYWNLNPLAFLRVFVFQINVHWKKTYIYTRIALSYLQMLMRYCPVESVNIQYCCKLSTDVNAVLSSRVCEHPVLL